MTPSSSLIKLIQQRNYFAHPHQSNTYITLRTQFFFPVPIPNPSKCLPRLLKRSPPPAARHLLAEKHLLRKKRLARRPPRPLAIKRSATRQERRPTLPTSTKVPISQFSPLIDRVCSITPSPPGSLGLD